MGAAQWNLLIITWAGIMPDSLTDDCEPILNTVSWH